MNPSILPAMNRYEAAVPLAAIGVMIWVMMFVGPIAFLLFFAFLSDTVRGKTFESIGAVMHWIDVYQPGSYLIVGAFIAAPLLSLVLVKSWPKPQEMENPLTRYRREHPDMMDQ